jgi:hypothetical protein
MLTNDPVYFDEPAPIDAAAGERVAEAAWLTGVTRIGLEGVGEKRNPPRKRPWLDALPGAFG